MHFCGLDIGTSGVKAVVFDERGSQKASAHFEYAVSFEADGTRVLSAAELWNKTKLALGKVAQEMGGKIDALSVDTFGEAFVMLDENDNVLHDIMIYTDRRGEDAYYKAMEQSSDEEIAKICGLPASPTYSISKVLYLKQQRSELYAKAKRILLIEDYMNYMLCGRAVVDYSAAARTMFFDVNELQWSNTLVEKFGIDIPLFSEPVKTGTVAGELLGSVAKELGICAGMKIVVGGHDQTICAIGSGLREGATVCGMGTSECITPIFDGMLDAGFIEKNGFPCEPVWEEGKYCTMAYNPSCGLMVQWFFQNFAAAEMAAEGKAPYALFEKNFPQEPTRLMVQPYLVGSGTPSLDVNARMGITGIGLGTTRFHIYRAVLEGMCLDQKLNMEMLAAQDIAIKRLVCVGGGANSMPWLQVKADVLQTPISTLKVNEAGALGCAIVCAYAMGVYGSIQQAAAEMSQIDKNIEPNVKNKQFYAEKFALYRNLRYHIMEESAYASDC